MSVSKWKYLCIFPFKFMVLISDDNYCACNKRKIGLFGEERYDLWLVSIKRLREAAKNGIFDPYVRIYIWVTTLYKYHELFVRFRPYLIASHSYIINQTVPEYFSRYCYYFIVELFIKNDWRGKPWMLHVPRVNKTGTKSP